MRNRLVRLAAVAGMLAGITLFTSGTAAHAGCPDPDNPCDPTPYKPEIPKVQKPTVTFGCGTVTVTVQGKSETAHVLPCPGPVIF
jgi:hypothetical protein